MEIWEDTDELRIAAAQRRWVSELRRSNPAMADRLTHVGQDVCVARGATASACATDAACGSPQL